MAGPTAASRNVTFRTDDGVTLAGTWYEPSARAGPAVILVHMLHRSRRDWDALASRLASEGIGALAFDLRGHGESSGLDPAPTVSSRRFSRTSGRRATVRRRARRCDPAPDRHGRRLARRSLAALDAAQSSSVQSMALLSASTEYRGLRIDAAMKKYAGRALLVYSDDDPYAQRSARDLIKLQGSSGSTRETLTLTHAGTAPNMLDRGPEPAACAGGLVQADTIIWIALCSMRGNRS